MTLYIEYSDQHITTYERPDGTWSVRLFRPKKASLHIGLGDVLIIKNKAGNEITCVKVCSFVPHVRYGHFTRSGHIHVEILF